MSRPAALVVVNPAARHGRAGALWEAVRPEVEARLDLSVVRLDEAGEWELGVFDALAGGVRVFVAAGGDGTVHALAAALVAAWGGRPLEELTLGAVGLGSSNDFHKPFRPGRAIPLRIDVDGATPRDLGSVVYRDERGFDRRTALVVSASVGVVAEGNELFNRSALGRRATGLAITVSALAAIARHRNLLARLRHDGVAEEVALSSLSVLKTPWLSGSLRYDVPVAPDDGALGVGLCEGMGALQLLLTLCALRRGRFVGRPGTRTFATGSLAIEADTPFILEVDGEVALASRARFDLFAGRIRACA